MKFLPLVRYLLLEMTDEQYTKQTLHTPMLYFTNTLYDLVRAAHPEEDSDSDYEEDSVEEDPDDDRRMDDAMERVSQRARG